LLDLHLCGVAGHSEMRWSKDRKKEARKGSLSGEKASKCTNGLYHGFEGRDNQNTRDRLDNIGDVGNDEQGCKCAQGREDKVRGRPLYMSAWISKSGITLSISGTIRSFECFLGKFIRSRTII
jgi:hypothetical protein